MPFNEFHYTPTGTGVISGKEVLEQTEDAINDLGGQISGDVQTAIDTANNALNTANTASTDAQNAVNTANTAYTAATNAQNTANAAQNTASNALTAAQNAQNDVNALGNRVTTAEGNITQNTTDISGLTTRMGTAEGNITTLQNDVVTAQGTATSAQNTATLARGQAYVVRYASVAVSDNSSVPYTDLNNTDNIKANDLLLDTTGKLYQISSVDTVNETAAVTTPLTYLALDSAVVHKNGIETIPGQKSFSSTPYIYNPNVSSSTPSLNLRNSKVKKGTTTDNGSQIIQFLDKDLKYLAQVIGDKLSNGSTAIKFNVGTLDGNAQSISAEIKLFIAVNGDKRFIPSTDNDVALGRSQNRWKDVNTCLVNGLTPSSLGMPTDNLSNVIDITGYLTVLDGSQANTYQAPDNGYISISMNNCSGIQAYITGFWGDQVARPSLGGVRFFMPVCKNMTVNILVYGGTVDNARFFPCQGNV